MFRSISAAAVIAAASNIAGALFASAFGNDL